MGKTTLTHLLAREFGCQPGLEQFDERPFQQAFANELSRYALANQVDYLLFRAEQEKALRQGDLPGFMDGGLEQDFYGFTRRFFQKGYLDAREMELCRRLYSMLRLALPPPDLVIRLVAPLEVIAARFARRGRPLEIARLEDLEALEALLDDWLEHYTEAPVLTIDASREDPEFARTLPELIRQVRQLIETGNI